MNGPSINALAADIDVKSLMKPLINTSVNPSKVWFSGKHQGGLDYRKKCTKTAQF
jgi:hypothetical protein